VAPPASAAAERAIATALEDLPAPVRLAAAKDVRAAVADRIVILLGGAQQLAELQAEFQRGGRDFVVRISVTMPGGVGIVPDEHLVGSLAGIWSEDDDVWCRRRFLVVDVPIGASLTVRCGLGAGYAWSSTATAVDWAPTGWTGQVSVLRAPPAVTLAEAMGDQVEVRLPDRSRVITRTSALEEHGIIVDGGRPRASAIAAPAPQPAPPRHFGHFGPVRAENALLTVTAPRPDNGPKVHLAAHEDRHWGMSVTEASADSIALLTAMPRMNPTGRGAVRGIDFAVTGNAAPVTL
jgi:hypothetical protein